MLKPYRNSKIFTNYVDCLSQIIFIQKFGFLVLLFINQSIQSLAKFPNDNDLNGFCDDHKSLSFGKLSTDLLMLAIRNNTYKS
jgi:hypothetical protein